MRHEYKQQVIKLAAILVVAASQVASQAITEDKNVKAVKVDQRRIVVSITDHKLVLFDADRVVKTYEIASGKSATPSPTGEFKVASMVTNPVYKAHGQDVAP